MRMRTDVDAAIDARCQIERPYMVEEDEGADHAPLRKRQHPADFEAAAEIAASLFDDHLNHRDLCLDLSR